MPYLQASKDTKSLSAVLRILEPQILCTLLICLKLLLIPSYKSTDFDVHRNWLAITRHLPIQEWYFDSQNGKTVHTLDYPPSFAFFEYFLSNNYLTSFLTKKKILDPRCLEILPDSDNHVGLDCVVFQRCTVILSDVIFWLGAWWLCQVLFTSRQRGVGVLKMPEGKEDEGEHSHSTKVERAITAKVAFALIVCNPGLILLDHIHFQYNGMLLGILLLSIAFLIRGMQRADWSFPSLYPSPSCEELMGAILFAILLTMKHLYLTLVPIYTVYLFRKFCFVSTAYQTKDEVGRRMSFSLTRLLLLGIIVLSVLILPFLPFLLAKNTNENEGTSNMLQIVSRLFPFQRGLCHDYWAGNIWALYLGFQKIAIALSRFAKKRMSGEGKIAIITSFIHLLEERYHLIPFPEITPVMAASSLLVGLIPSMICAWKAAVIAPPSYNDIANEHTLLYCIVFSSLSSFMLAYHVHEKAIMTSIIPMTLMAFTSRDGARLYLRLMTLGHFGLLPLLFRPTELLLKILLNWPFFVGSFYLLENMASENDKDHESDRRVANDVGAENLMTTIDKVGLFIMALLIIFSEVIYPIFLKPKEQMEFLPLMLISLLCAIGLVLCWLQCGRLMFRWAYRRNEVREKVN